MFSELSLDVDKYNKLNDEILLKDKIIPKFNEIYYKCEKLNIFQFVLNKENYKEKTLQFILEEMHKYKLNEKYELQAETYFSTLIKSYLIQEITKNKK